MNARFTVAAPWNLTHYIQLNGFHPLYRALFDNLPSGIKINSWDNIRLHSQVSNDQELLNELKHQVQSKNNFNTSLYDQIEKQYAEYFWPSNQVLTQLLVGDIEFHHTAPFPSLKRPFVFHCESFAPIFHPFALEGTFDADIYTRLRSHYQKIFANPLCLGIFSHIPETLNNIRIFFNDETINNKLFSSRMGLSNKALNYASTIEKPPITITRFLFVNSANQNPNNFFTRGGHIVLRFWKNFVTNGREGRLMMRCVRPSDSQLANYAVDVAFIQAETGRSIIWINDYLTNDEQNSLMASAHFLLLPSMCLHSVSIMQSMTLGAIPVVTDTVGTSFYVNNDQGIVLNGVRSNLWRKDLKLGIELNSCNIIPALDDSLVEQMTQRIVELLDKHGAFQKLQNNTIQHAKKLFSGEDYSLAFWNQVSDLINKNQKCFATRPLGHIKCNKNLRKLAESTMDYSDIARVFESPTQPLRKIYTGRSIVFEMGGALIHAYGNPRMEINDWSFLAHHLDPKHPKIIFAKTLHDFKGQYLTSLETNVNHRCSPVQYISNKLMPFPILHSIARAVKNTLRPIYRYLIHLFDRFTKQADIRLIIENHFGYNIIEYLGSYYAIPMSDGAFKIKKIRKKQYSSVFVGNSMEKLLNKITLAKSHETIQ